MATVLLTLTLVVAFVGSFRLSRRLDVGLAAYAPGAIAMGLPVAILVTGIGVAGRLSRSFDVGLAGALVLAIAVLVLALRLPSIEVADEARVSRTEHLWFDAMLVAVGVLYCVLAVRYEMHDEYAIFGHKSMVEQIRNGDYPLFLPPIPAQDARYHYGFDLLAGALARGFGLSGDAAIDVTTVYLAVLISWGAAALASTAGARRVAPFAGVAVHLGAGLAWVVLAGRAGRHPRCLMQYHHPTCDVDLFPTQLLNVFQHPVSLGLALLLVLVLLARAVAESRRHVIISSGLMLLVLPALLLGQVVYFALGTLAIIAALPVWATLGDNRERSGAPGRRSAVLVAVILLGLGLGYLGGGMFTSSPVTDPGLVVVRKAIGFPEKNGPLGVLYHHVVNLGLGFVLLPVFVFVSVRRRRFVVLVLTAFAIGGLIVPQIWVYTRSWDIVKFPSASAYMLAILYVIVVDEFFAGATVLQTWLQRSGRVLLTGSGFVSAAYLLFLLPPHLRPYRPDGQYPDATLQRTIEWFKDRKLTRGELIYGQSNIAPLLSVFGGLSVVGGDADFIYLGIRAEIIMRQRRLTRQIKSRMEPRALDELGVKWVVLSEEELPNLGRIARAALEDSTRFERVFTAEAPTPKRSRTIWRRLESDGVPRQPTLPVRRPATSSVAAPASAKPVRPSVPTGTPPRRLAPDPIPSLAPRRALRGAPPGVTPTLRIGPPSPSRPPPPPSVPPPPKSR